MENSVENSISTKELFTEFDWYQSEFSGIIQEVSDDFFDKNFQSELIGISKNINCLIGDDACFVTKVKIEKDYDMFFRVNEKAVEIILDKILGKPKNRFNLNTVTELETKILTSFNAYLFNVFKDKISSPDPKELSRTNFDIINLTFIIKDIDPDNKSAGKIVVTLPQILLTPQKIISTGEKFSKNDFNKSKIEVKIKVGTTSFSVFDIKNLETGDLVIFENSSLRKLRLSLFDEEMDVNINPNMNLFITEKLQEGDNRMAENHNLWDSIEVDMHAEFDSVKITLGELKNIEQGLVVDLASLYDNKVTLRVEGKDIAKGSLVIVNDRYGVKIDEIIAKNETSASAPAQNQEQEVIENEEFSEDETTEETEAEEIPEESEEEETEEYEEVQESEDEDEEFDYSDFELEDENI